MPHKHVRMFLNNDFKLFQRVFLPYCLQEEYGIPAQLYTDRDSVYWHTKKAGGKVDPENLTQFGRVMDELGVEMIPAYSPQARGWSERWNGTWQGRLVAELRREGIDNIEAQYINEVFLPDISICS